MTGPWERYQPQRAASGPWQRYGAQSDETEYGGLGMNTTAGMNEALYAVAGAPVDLMRGTLNLGIRGVNRLTGSEIDQIPENSFGGSRFIGETMGRVAPQLDPENTKATTTAERIARGTGQGVAGTIAPAAIVGGLARAGTLGPQGAELGARLAGRSSTVGGASADALAGAMAGAGASAAMEVTPDRYKPLAALAGGLTGGAVGSAATGLPGLARETVRAGREYARPLTAGGRERMAGEVLRDAASDPRALRESLEAAGDPLIPGSEPTTGQLSGDMGILAAERGAQSRHPAEFQQRRADQNSARRDAIESLQPEGAAENVTRALRQRLEQIDRDTLGDLDMTTETAIGRQRQLGPQMRPEEAGDQMRTVLQRRRDLAKQREQRLWDAVDPDGTLALPAQNAARIARNVDSDIPASAKPPSGEEAAIYDVLRQYGDVVPFRELSALRSRVSTAIADERGRHGQSPTYARLVQVRSAIERDIESAVAGRVLRETEAVAAGTMRAEDTLEARWTATAEDWLVDWQQQRATGSGGGTSSGPSSRGATSAISGQAGTGRQTGGRSGSTPRNPRLSPEGLEPNFDRAAAERLNRATDATRERASTFDNRNLGPLLARPADHSPYNMDSARVASRVFQPGANGFERIQQFRRAAGTKRANDALEAYAVDNLRKRAMNEDGTLDPAKLKAWRRSHADALRAFPELNIRLDSAADAAEVMASMAVRRKAALDDAQKGALGRIVGTDDPSDVSRIVGGLFSRQDSVRQLAQIRRAIGDDKQALEGIRKATADYLSTRLLSNTEAATSGQTLLKSDQFQTFVRSNKNALRTVFSAEEVSTLEAIAADLQRANRSLTAVKIPGQSNTVQDALAVTSGDTGVSILGKLVTGGMATGGALAGGAVGGVPGAALGAGGAALVGALRQNGIQQVDELVRDALLHPSRARMLLSKVPAKNPAREEAMYRSLARRYVKTALGTGIIVADTSRPDEPTQLPPITITPRDPLTDALMSR